MNTDPPTKPMPEDEGSLFTFSDTDTMTIDEKNGLGAMSFGDETVEPHCANCIVFRCRRKGCIVTEAHEDPSTALRRMVEAGQLATLCQCDGVLSVADLIGTGPGKPWQAKTEAAP